MQYEFERKRKMKTKRVLTLKRIRGNTFRITKQSHREDFTATGIAFRASNGITLKSLAGPEWSGGSNVLYVRGSCVEADNGNVIIPKPQQARVLAAVREYNRKSGVSPVPFKTKWADYDVTITPTTLTVGCSEFSIKDFRSLVKLVDKATKKKA
jgi:hypothetical protein